MITPTAGAPSSANAGPFDTQLFAACRPASALQGPVCCLAIDAEEDFDWTTPIQTTDFSVDCMRRIADLREILTPYRIRPTYLLTYPVLEDTQVVNQLRRQHAQGDCDLGIQLHPWVTPPFDEPAGRDVSYLGNLPRATEERKLLSLMAKFRQRFGFDPTIFRAGRYGLSVATTRLLEQNGFAIDTSIAPRTNFAADNGPDYSRYDSQPFWFGRSRPVLEVPLCRGVVGWAGAVAPAVYRAATSVPAPLWFVPALLSRMRCAERITLSPEGNDVAAMLRLLRHRMRLGQTVFTLSFHSSSLAAGRNPYVRSREDLHYFYDRLSAVLTAMETKLGVRFVALGELPRLLGGGAA